MATQANAQPHSLSKLSIIDKLSERGQHELDKYFPPERRDRLYAALQTFMLANPKLSAFLATNAVLTGIPLLFFTIFTLSTCIFSISIGLLVGLGGAILFTLACAGTALLFLVPTIFLTTLTACFLFCGGLGVYYVLQLAGNSRSRGSKQRVERYRAGNDGVDGTSQTHVNGSEDFVKG